MKLVRDDELNNWKLEFDFGEDARKEGESGEPVDFSEQESLGHCPKTQGNVYEFGSNYVCEHSVGVQVTCDFKSGKVILQQPVAREQMTKLLTTGATDLLEGFISNKTRRKFKARLSWDAKEGKVSFAFEPRPERPGAKKAGAGSAAAGSAAPSSPPSTAAGSVGGKTSATKAVPKKAPAKTVAAGNDAATRVAAKKVAVKKTVAKKAVKKAAKKAT